MTSEERRRWVLMLGGLTALGPLAIDAYLPTLPTIQRELHTTDGAVQLTLSAYFLGLAAGQLLWGPIADRVGRKRPLLAGLLLYAAGSIVCALSPRIEVLAAGRVLQAIGGSAGIVVVRAIVRDRWVGREAAAIMSSIVLVMGAAPILAPTLGGLMLGWAGWRGIFAALAIAASIAFAGIWRALPETGGGGEPESIARAARAVGRDRRFVAYALAGSFAQAGMFAYIAGAPFAFIEMQHVSPSVFAILFGTNAAGFVAASQINRRLLGSRDHTSIALGSTVATATLGAVLLATVWNEGVGTITLACLFFAYVASLGFTGSNTTAAALEQQGARAGMASALLGTVQFTTAALGSAAVGALADGTARPMAIVMLCTAVIALACVVVGRTTDERALAPAE